MSIPVQSDISDFAEEYAAFSSKLAIDTMPKAVVEAAKVNLADTLACSIAGFTAKGVADVSGLMAGWGGRDEATIWSTGVRVPAPHAAMANGMTAHARDYDDTHDGAVLHAGVSVVPSAIAACELNPTATGADLIAGVVAGLELICRLGVATQIGIIESGFMYTALFGHFAGTAAAARVLGLDASSTANALGIVYSQAAGTHQVTRDGALTKRMQPGFAARSALFSVALAQLGIVGTKHTFEGPDGLFQSYLRGRYDPSVLRQGLSEEFELLNLSYKPYPCCRFNHSAIEAALAVREALQGDISDIVSINCGVNSQAYQAVCTPVAMRKAPASVVQAQFSLPYCVARALLQGHVGLTDFLDTAIADDRVRSLANLVDARVDPEIEAQWSRSVSPAALKVVTRRGIFEHRIDLPLGHPERKWRSSDAMAKLLDCLTVGGRPSSEQAAGRFLEIISDLENCHSGASILRVFGELKPT